MAQWVMNPTNIHKDADLILGLLRELRIQSCHELWCRSQMWLGPHAAVAFSLAPIMNYCKFSDFKPTHIYYLTDQ